MSGTIAYINHAGEIRQYIQARSGRVAFPRTKVVPPMDARMEGEARTAERMALVRKRVVAIMLIVMVVFG